MYSKTKRENILITYSGIIARSDRSQLVIAVTYAMRLFKTGSIDVVKDCQSCFAIDQPSCVLIRRQDKFILQYISTVNGFANFATL